MVVNFQGCVKKLIFYIHTIMSSQIEPASLEELQQMDELIRCFIQSIEYDREFPEHPDLKFAKN